METETGWVEELQNENAVLRLKTNSKCNHCGAKMVCGSDNGVTKELTVPNPLHARVGDQVEISYQEASRILSAFLVFIVPIILLIAGYIFGYIRSQSETVGALWALIGLVVGFLILWLTSKLLGKKRGFLPQMLRIIEVPENDLPENSANKTDKSNQR